MGGSSSKEEMVYLAVQKGDLRGIRKLRAEGASLEVSGGALQLTACELQSSLVVHLRAS